MLIDEVKTYQSENSTRVKLSKLLPAETETEKEI